MFWSRYSTEQCKLNTILGEFAIGIHVLQAIGEIIVLTKSLNFGGLGDNNSRYLCGALGTSFTLWTALIVQFHFSRVAYILLHHGQLWVLVSIAGGLITMASGHATAFHFFVTFFQAEKKPLSNNKTHRFLLWETAFDLSWYISTFICNIAICSVIMFRLIFHKTNELQKILQEALKRFSWVTIGGFALVCTAEVASIFCISVPYVREYSTDQKKSTFEYASFLINSLTTRIYLICFFWSISPPEKGESDDLEIYVAYLPNPASVACSISWEAEYHQNP
ncbi:hypothetical protein O181_007168 [Austropuccinia psidii MF-1]|uniref:Uncharacterized protein n=1 Tax=Austropuccinia psidii MF-1 TaxID=1389203 RepID=A0A9Q3GHA8_9BASI|nr:hypothetical protein [Austropuccinia psidii MF-1]